MAYPIGRNIAFPLLFLNLLLYIILLGFASSCLNKFINGQSHHPGFGGNGATIFFLEFAILAAVIGIVSKFAGLNHLRAWRSESLAVAGTLSLVSWALTSLAFGLACKEINIGGNRGWRLRVVEAFTIMLGFTQLLYLIALHWGVISINYGNYYDTDFGLPGSTYKPSAAAPAATSTATV